MRKTWTEQAWDDYLYWQTQDKKTLRKVNQLIQDIEGNGFATGIGKPEPLKADLQGCWSRHIDSANRLVYMQSPDGSLCIIACRGHYET